MNNKWCHESCKEVAEMREAHPIFYGVCYEGCIDELCTLEHSDYCN